eukprot:scaffold166211_cov18-Tisochrysis_lutea.AAC.1
MDSFTCSTSPHMARWCTTHQVENNAGLPAYQKHLQKSGTWIALKKAALSNQDLQPSLRTGGR